METTHELRNVVSPEYLTRMVRSLGTVPLVSISLQARSMIATSKHNKVHGGHELQCDSGVPRGIGSLSGSCKDRDNPYVPYVARIGKLC